MMWLIYHGYQLLYDILNDNLFDVNPARRQIGERFIHPTLPTSLDEKYPRFAIKLESFVPIPVGAGNVLEYQPNCRTTGMWAQLGFRILVFVKKEAEYPIEIDNIKITAKNDLLIEYLVQQVYQVLFNAITDGSFNTSSFWVNSIADLTVSGASWEFDTSRIVSEIGITLMGVSSSNQLLTDAAKIQTINHILDVNI